MKKLYIFALAIIGIYVCLNLSSCKKDDDEVSSPSIIGIWDCYEYQYNDITETDVNYGYVVITDSYIGLSNKPSMPTAETGGEKYAYTYDESTMVATLVDIDLDTNQPYDSSVPFEAHVTKLTSDQLWAEWTVNGYYELFKCKRYK